MILELTSNELNPSKYWSIQIPYEYQPTPEDISLFDVNGYDLCKLEQEYAKVNTPAFNHRYKKALKYNWMKDKIEDIALNTDWDSAAKELIERKNEWATLPFFEQSDWKCKFYGIEPENFKEIVWSSI